MVIYGSILEDGRPVNTSRKYTTAVEKNIKLMSESEFDDLLYKKTGIRLMDGLGAALQKMSIPTQQSTPAGTTPIKTPTTTSNKTTTTTGQISTTKDNKAPQKNTSSSSTSSDGLWTHKYSPQNIGEIIGNQNFIRDIMQWLKDWDDVVLRGEKKEVKFNPNKSKDNWQTSNVNARACLVSGPPGIGKTTAVRLIAKTMGYELIEQNASDVRNKSAVENLLNHLKDNQTVKFTQNEAVTNNKFIIMMDEVDGMSAGDRGGNKVLIETIKATKRPIICICNDRQHPKVRTLANYCYDIRFHKPSKQQVAKRVAEICASEGLRVDLNSLEYLCENFGNDIRQILNFLQMYSKRGTSLTYMDAKNSLAKVKKDETVMMNNFDAAKKLMSSHNLPLREKIDLFFIDYDLIPLLVQENYLPNNPKPSLLDLAKVAEAADLISTGDILNRAIRNQGEWGLMPNFAFMSAIAPCEIVNPNVAWPKFPEWLGKNSSQRKKYRELRELRGTMAHAITGTRKAVLLDYLKPTVELINYNLQGDDKAGVESVIEIMDHYGLNPDMVKDHLMDLQIDKKDPLSGVSTQTKSSLTRTYNTRHKSSIKTKKPKRVIGGGGEGEGHRFNPEAEEEEAPIIEEDEEEDSTEDNVEIEEKVIKGKDKSATKGKDKGKGGDGGGKKKK